MIINRLKTVSSLFALLFALSLPLFAASTRYEGKVVDQIELTLAVSRNQENLDKNGLLNRLKTRVGAPFSQTDFDQDLKGLINEYDRVDPTFETSNDQLVIKMKLWPKPLIRSISWVGNEKLKEQTLRDELGIKAGTVFDRQAFIKAFHKVKSYYVKKGYFEAELEYQVAADPESNDIDITIEINEGRSGRIEALNFIGFTKEEEEDLSNAILTKKYNFFTSWLSGEGTYKDEMLQQDKLIILNYLQNQGYADAQIDIRVKESSSKNRIILEIEADKGELYTLSTITFSGNMIFSDEQIRSRFAMKEGGPYSPEKVRETIQNIQSMYGRHGYIDVLVSFQPQLDPEERSYALNLKIEEGGVYRVGLVKIFGNHSTQTCVILHETLLVPGDIFNFDKLRLTEMRLSNIGYFEHVNVYTVKSDDCETLGDNYRDVYIEVEEKQTGSFTFSFGFSTAESIFGTITITERNFNYKGIPYLFSDGYSAMRGGGEYAYIKTQVGNKHTSYLLSWTKPYFMDSRWTVGFDLERSYNRLVSHDFSIDAIGLVLRGKYTINQYLKVGLHYRIRDTDVRLINSETVNELLQDEASNSGLISGAGIGLFYDSTNHPVEPTEGFRSILDTEFVGLGGSHHFFNIAYLNTIYTPISEYGTLKFRADFKLIIPVGDTRYSTLPIDERLFLGGDYVIRGYRPYALGPHYKGGDPRGGTSMSIVSYEYSYKISQRFDGFAFFDAGDISDETFAIESIRTSVGFGMRCKVFAGAPPVSIGMGFPLNARNETEVKKFFLTLGGKF